MHHCLPGESRIRIERTVHGFVQQFPNLSHPLVAETIAGTTVTLQPSVDVDAVPRPAHIREQFVYNFVIFKAFRRATEAHEVLRILRSERLRRRCRIHVKVACREHLASEIRHVAENPLLAVEALLNLPGLLRMPHPFRIIVAQVNDDHLVVRHSGEHSLKTFRIPEIVLITESPALCYPNRFRVTSHDGVIDGFSVFCEQFMFTLRILRVYREFHFVKTI